MSIRKTILSVALVGAFVVPAFASDTTSASSRGEAAYSGPMPGDTTHEMHSDKTRADVVRDVQRARQNDTLRWVGDYPRATVGTWTAAALSAGTAVSRDSVRRDLQAFQQNPVTPDGYRFINGEIGDVYVGPRSAR